MPIWVQHLLVFALIGFALVVVIRQVVGTLRLRHGRIGSCCAKGCATPKTGEPSERIVFLPVDALKHHQRK